MERRFIDGFYNVLLDSNFGESFKGRRFIANVALGYYRFDCTQFLSQLESKIFQKPSKGRRVVLTDINATRLPFVFPAVR